jgi:hypothetical protein
MKGKSNGLFVFFKYLDEAFINVSAVCRRCEPLIKTLKASNGVSQVASMAPMIVFV